MLQDRMKFEGQIQERVLEIECKVHELPTQIVQGVTNMRNMHNEIKERMVQAFEDYNRQLRVDAERLQEIET